MKYVGIVLAFLIAGCSEQPKNTYQPNGTTVSAISDEDEQVLRNLNKVLWPKAYDEQDTALLNKVLHDDFQLIDDNGDTYSKNDEMEYITNYAPSYSSYEFQIDRLSVFENGTAIVTGKGIMKGVNDEGAYITTYRTSNTLIKVGDEWKAINSHVSGVKEEVFPNALTK